MRREREFLRKLLMEFYQLSIEILIDYIRTGASVIWNDTRAAKGSLVCLMLGIWYLSLFIPIMTLHVYCILIYCVLINHIQLVLKIGGGHVGHRISKPGPLLISHTAKKYKMYNKEKISCIVNMLYIQNRENWGGLVLLVYFIFKEGGPIEGLKWIINIFFFNSCIETSHRKMNSLWLVNLEGEGYRSLSIWSS